MVLELAQRPVGQLRLGTRLAQDQRMCVGLELAQLVARLADVAVKHLAPVRVALQHPFVVANPGADPVHPDEPDMAVQVDHLGQPAAEPAVRPELVLCRRSAF